MAASLQSQSTKDVADLLMLWHFDFSLPESQIRLAKHLYRHLVLSKKWKVTKITYKLKKVLSIQKRVHLCEWWQIHFILVTEYKKIL